jgi:signal transduction histidine kinase
MRPVGGGNSRRVVRTRKPLRPEPVKSAAAKQRQLAAELSHRLDDITRLVSDWVWETDEYFQLTYLSERVFEVSGFLPLVLVGKKLGDLGTFYSNAGAPIELNWRQPFRDVSFEILGSDGHPRLCLVSGLPVYNLDTGKFEGARGTARDVTAQRAAEKALRESEQRHRDFASDVAHELRTPLAVLRSRLEKLDDSETQHAMRDDVMAMSRLLEQMLAAARLETLKADNFEPVDIRAVCIKVATNLGHLAIKEGRSIEIVGHESPVMVRGDAEAISQAVRNLVENAIKYSAKNTTISIEVGRGRSIRVVNRGASIPLDKRSVIFKRFERADRRSDKRGLGIGLAIVKRVVDAHDARIKVSDTPGGGAVFTIQFPPVDG